MLVTAGDIGEGLLRDACGRAQQQLAGRAHRLHLAALGCIVRLKPNPLALVSAHEGGETP